MSKWVLDISEYWPRGDWKQPLPVNTVYRDPLLNPREIDRGTLKRALEGKLDRARIETIEAIVEACSIWSGEEVKYQDVRKKVADEDLSDE